MATIKFQLIGQKSVSQIYIRISIDRNNVFRKNTGYTIDPRDWSAATSLPKQTSLKLKNLRTRLERLRVEVLDRLNIDYGNGISIDTNWLKIQLDDIQGRRIPTDLSYLSNYFDYYIENLPLKVNSKGKRTSPATIKKYKTICGLINDFEKFKKRQYQVKDVNLNFRQDFIEFLSAEKKYSDNYIGRVIKFVKSVCLDARTNDIEVSNQLDKIKGFTTEAFKIYLTLEEIKKLEEANLKGYLDNARDWLVIGCYLGQRVSDLLVLTKKNIQLRDGFEYIELKQKKTGKTVAIPIDKTVRAILKKNNGFPRKISDQKFNLYIKKVAKSAGITELTKGSKVNKETNRKEIGEYPKCELVTSHIMRRSFATNFYGEIPTPLLISITAHSTESQFLEYIGKGPLDYAQQLAQYWARDDD